MFIHKCSVHRVHSSNVNNCKNNIAKRGFVIGLATNWIHKQHLQDYLTRIYVFLTIAAFL